MTKDNLDYDDCMFDLLFPFRENQCAALPRQDGAHFIAKMSVEAALKGQMDNFKEIDFRLHVRLLETGAIVIAAIGIPLGDGSEWWTGAYINPDNLSGLEVLERLMMFDQFHLIINDDQVCLPIWTISVETNEAIKGRAMQILSLSSAHNAKLSITDFDASVKAVEDEWRKTERGSQAIFLRDA